MISGFLIARGGGRRSIARMIVGRLAPIFLFGEIVHVAADVVLAGALYPLPEATAKGIARFVAVSIYNGGVAFHLWFLVRLAISTAIFVGLRRFGPIVVVGRGRSLSDRLRARTLW